MGGEVGEELVVAVAERARDEAEFVQLGDAARAVGPGGQEVPGAGYFEHLVIAPQTLQLPFLQQRDERAVVVLVDGFGGLGWVVRAREYEVAVPPLLGEGAPV